ncbi:hypothetical protein UFOVP4_4 [uncultured Caudovirales phage]|uniref:Uncharacterized protein n=1 Tax=uncultured Caudovirales phage TaxID=2100421 RepID=A0A6J7VLN8_9CAUD|nr:hypothetical protein UFOVP4_4 [uncultured Caudovirales phage]CAB4241357.1 hypothetical protein UFOVP64_55 [uncultured Caudovirales phage]CAB5078970.1 hypothetical protein UFOVP145_11 [uncultured Caudovirales phage]
MCDPISIAAALTVAGTAANYAGNKQAERASLSAFNTEQRIQKQKTAEQDLALDNSNNTTKKLLDPNAQADAVNARKEAFIAALNTRPAGQDYLPGQEGAPTIVADAAAKASADQRSYSEQQAGALANMQGFGDQMFGTNIAVGRNGQMIGQLGKDKFNSANVLDSELRAASYKGQDLRNIGTLAQQIGLSMLAGGAGSAASGAGGKILSSAMPRISSPIPIGAGFG